MAESQSRSAGQGEAEAGALLKSAWSSPLSPTLLLSTHSLLHQSHRNSTTQVMVSNVTIHMGGGGVLRSKYYCLPLGNWVKLLSDSLESNPRVEARMAEGFQTEA